MNLTREQLDRFVARLAAQPERWRHLVRHEEEIRVHEPIWSDAQVNAWVICWSDGQDTGFHDHDESTAAIAVIAGCVREERLSLTSEPRVTKYASGERLIVPPVAIHRVMHEGDGPATTIHAYSPPLVRTGVYRSGPDGELLRESRPCDFELRAEPIVS